MRPSQLVAALIVGATSALDLTLLPHPWAECVTVAIAIIGALYIDRGTLTRCPDCGTVHELMAPPTEPPPAGPGKSSSSRL